MWTKKALNFDTGYKFAVGYNLSRYIYLFYNNNANDNNTYRFFINLKSGCSAKVMSHHFHLLYCTAFLVLCFLQRIQRRLALIFLLFLLFPCDIIQEINSTNQN